ncbi:porin family protein [uncultured Algibacter sp.]|uniref:porin family protein n=1 Tax=uncultured Algibacter sp. TaxID=298659 RepID=UPI00262E89C6|nr:porin family protein [uncultured Algibacter sp.]
MKKALLSAILFCFSIYGFSQEELTNQAKDTVKVQQTNSGSKSVKYGIRGGLNISNLDFDETIAFDNKHRNSVFIGFLACIRFSKTFSLMPELQFSAEGAKAEPLHLDYIQAPILFRFKLSNKIHAGVGPQVGLKVHKEGDLSNNMAYSGVAGLEYRLNYALFVDARYTYGFRNVFNDNVGLTAKNTNIQVGIGYKF